MPTLETLRYIAEHDPDGWAREPCQRDYEQFERWVIAHWGRKTLHLYRTTNWEQ